MYTEAVINHAYSEGYVKTVCSQGLNILCKWKDSNISVFFLLCVSCAFKKKITP